MSSGMLMQAKIPTLSAEFFSPGECLALGIHT
jgi:hypothetical protein